jgi:polyhydroxyalkanoate synthesis regulator phasin
MTETVEIPIGGLNQIPGVSGLEDVEFEILTVGDVVDAIAENTVDKTDVDEAVVSAVEDVVGEGVEIAADAVDLTDETIEDIVSAIEDSLGIDVPGDGSVIDGIGDVTLGEEQVEDLVDEAVRDVLGDMSPDEATINIEGIFGPLSQDVAEALEAIIEFDPEEFIDEILDELTAFIEDLVSGEGDVDFSLPSTEDVEAAIEDGLDGLSPDVDGVEFWSDPLDFLEELWDEIEPLIVDPDVIADLERALNENPPPNQEDQ